MDKWVAAEDIASALSATSRGVRKRAAQEKWARRMQPVRGGKQYRYRLIDLPEDVQTAFAKREKTSLEALRNQLQPASKPSQKVVVPRYTGRGAATHTPKLLEHIPEEYLHVAAARRKVIEAWSASGLTVEQFVTAYNNGIAVPELREQLGGHGAIASFQSFYRWLAEFEQHGLAGLAPRYAKRRGGNGASLDDHAKELIRALYLDDSRPSCRSVERDVKQFGFDINYSMIYRYLRDEVPQAVKAFYREGEKAYHDRYDPYVPRDYTQYRSMEWGVADHHMFDFVVEHKGKSFAHGSPSSRICVVAIPPAGGSTWYPQA